MKKIFLLLMIVVIIFIHTGARAFVVKNIDLKLKDNETSIVFLKLKSSTSLLISTNNSSDLFILDYKNLDNLDEALKIFKSKPSLFYLKNDIDRKIDNIHITKENDTFKFQIANYMLCIYNRAQKNSCDFVYLRNLDKEFTINDNISAIFYDEDIDKKFLKEVEESWVESNIVSKESFTILKLNEESYNVVIVPSTNLNN